MFKKFKKHLGYYITLILILSFGLILILLTSPDVKMQAMIIFITVFFYILWGLLHHLINHELTPRIVIEYVLIGALGLSVLFFTLMGGIL
jgi:multisubunit Na+/H+ antiporter MnhB subunit